MSQPVPETAPARRHPCLAALDGAEGSWSRGWREAAYAAGDVLPGGQVSLVLAGTVRVALPPSRDGAVAFRDVSAGGAVGDLEALAEAPAAFTATALAPVRVVHMPPAAFSAMLHEVPAAALAVLASHAREAVAAVPRAPGASADAAASLARELLRLAEASPGGAALTVARLPRHRELAAWTGLTEEDVAGAMADLVRSGCVARRYPGLEILDRARLEALAAE